MGVTEYVALPANARRCIARLAALVGLSFDFIPTGPDRVQTIVLRHPLG